MSVAVNILGMRPAASSLFLAGGVMFAALGLASCSSNISRFDYPMFASDSDQQNASMTTASVNPVPTEPVYQSGSQPGYQPTPQNPYGQQPYGQQAVVRSELPPPAIKQPAPVTRQPAQTRVAVAAPRPAPRPEPMPLPAKKAPLPKPKPKPVPVKVTVKRGDTLTAIARKHDVAVKDIMRANKLKDTRLSLGQRLVIPGAEAPPARVARTYKVRPGDSLSAIGKKYNLDYRKLARHNGMKDNAVLRLGQVLKIPGEKAKASAPVRVASRGAATPVPAASTARKPKPVAARPQKHVALSKPTLPEPKPMTGNQFRWPVRGRIISGFGPKSSGKHNDGINVAVPLGTSVKSAENGVVAYAGSELQGYGNLVLIRHSNNWVSAYAHNDEVLVKRGDEVRRGQVIGKAGKSGSVSQPQVHFELRKGSQPVNPLKHMASS